MSHLKDTSKLSNTSHKRQNGKSTGKVAVIDLTLLDSDADPSPDSDSDIEILPSKKRAKTSTSHSSKPSPTKHLEHVQPDSSATTNHHAAAHHSGAGAAAQIAGSSELGVSGLSGSKSAVCIKEKDAELGKARQDRAFATELEEARKLRKEAAMAAEKLEKKAKATPKKTGKGGDGIVYLSVVDANGQLLKGDDDGDNLHHLAKIKEIFPAYSVATGTNTMFRGYYRSLNLEMEIMTVTRFVNQTLLDRFEAAKQALKAARRPTKQLMLFHGTGPQNIPKIMKSRVEYFRASSAHNVVRDSHLVLPTYVIDFKYNDDLRVPFATPGLAPAPVPEPQTDLDPEEQYRAMFEAAGFGDFF